MRTCAAAATRCDMPVVRSLLCWHSTFFVYFRYESRRVILREGHPGHAFYIILSGSVFINVKDVDCRTMNTFNRTDATLSRGQSFGVRSMWMIWDLVLGHRYQGGSQDWPKGSAHVESGHFKRMIPKAKGVLEPPYPMLRPWLFLPAIAAAAAATANAGGTAAVSCENSVETCFLFQWPAELYHTPIAPSIYWLA